MSYNEPTLCMVLAESCPACMRFKKDLDTVKKTLDTEGIKYEVFVLKSTSDNPLNYGVPKVLADAARWFPIFAVCGKEAGNVVLLDIFNAERTGSGWKYKDHNTQSPNAITLKQFYRDTVARYNGPKTGIVTTTGDLKMTAPPTTPAGMASLPGTASSMMNRPMGFIPTSACKSGGFKGRVI